MSLELSKYVLDNGPWSISKAGVIQKCSLQYDWKYGANKRPEDPKDVSSESKVGVCVHAALEFALDDISTKQAFQFARDQDASLTQDELDTVDHFYEQVDSFAMKMRNFRVKYGVRRENVFRERKIALTPDFKNTQFFDKKGLFRGVIDYMLLTANGDAIIFDHKTGKQKEMKYYEDQCKAYCLLALTQFPEIKAVQTFINFVQTDTRVPNARVTAEQIRDEYRPWLVQFLNESCKNLLLKPNPQEGWWCDWCGFKSTCPAKQKNAPAPVIAAAP